MKTDKFTKKIIVFASGNGSNAINMYHYFNKIDHIEVSHIFSNKPHAPVLKKANDLGVTAIHFDRDALNSGELLEYIQQINPDLIVLAGFLWKIPEPFIKTYPQKIVNIHPSLLPQYGGKGMYGSKVHKAVINDNANTSGITIHYVNEVYDEGEIIAQFEVEIDPTDDHNQLAEKIHSLEYQHFPKVVHKLLT